jgi:hypothetical protein
MFDTPPIRELITWIRSSAAPFYRDRWGHSDDLDIPAITRSDFVNASLSTRRYKNERALVKTVNATDGAFLSEWSFADIGGEQYGEVGMRPMVYFGDPDESIEKAMWCYENDLLPVIGENLPEVANDAADFYSVDSLIADSISLPKLLPHLSRRNDQLKSLIIVGNSFDIQQLHAYCAYAQDVRLVASLPETGAFAVAPLSNAPEFTPLPGCIFEHSSTLLLTKEARLVTPIVRLALPPMENFTLRSI